MTPTPLTPPTASSDAPLPANPLGAPPLPAFTPAESALVDGLVAALLAARRSGVPLPATPAWCNGVNSVELAAAVQAGVGQALGAWAPGQVPGVWKSGAGSRDRPLSHAPCLPEGVVQLAAGEEADLRGRAWQAPGLEAEVALKLGQAVTPAMARALTPESAAALVSHRAVAVEVVASRWAPQPEPTALLKTADFQVHGGLVIGPWQAVPASERTTPRDWSAQACRLALIDTASGRVIEQLDRTGTHPLGTPEWLLPIWLAHLTRHGATVPAGTVVTTGTWTGMTPLQPGQQARVAFEGLGEVRLRY